MTTYLPPIPQAPTIDIEPVGDGWWCGSLYTTDGTAIVQCFHPSRDAALASVRECQRAVIRGIRQKLARSNLRGRDSVCVRIWLCVRHGCNCCRCVAIPQNLAGGENMTKQIKRAEAVREIVAIRERLQVLKEQMEPLPFGLAQDANASLHLLRTFEDQTRRHYRWNEESP